MESVFTVFKAANLCKVSSKTIINWVESGHIKAYKTVGGHRRIKQSDLENFMKTQGIPIPGEETNDGKKRVLVVDDDPIVVETIVQGLEEDEHDYDVESASDGFEAGLKVKDFKPHLMILDIMMPGIKGDEVCRKVKSNKDTEHIKILILSAYLDDDRFKQMKDYGADVCFSKPLQLPQLKKEVARLLEI